MGKEITVERRAVHIAAVVMQAAGLCRYDDFTKCRKYLPDDEDCVKCIERWCLSKASRELAQGKNA